MEKIIFDKIKKDNKDKYGQIELWISNGKTYKFSLDKEIYINSKTLHINKEFFVNIDDIIAIRLVNILSKE